MNIIKKKSIYPVICYNLIIGLIILIFGSVFSSRLIIIVGVLIFVCAFIYISVWGIEIAIIVFLKKIHERNFHQASSSTFQSFLFFLYFDFALRTIAWIYVFFFNLD